MNPDHRKVKYGKSLRKNTTHVNRHPTTMESLQHTWVLWRQGCAQTSSRTRNKKNDCRVKVSPVQFVQFGTSVVKLELKIIVWKGKAQFTLPQYSKAS